MSFGCADRHPAERPTAAIPGKIPALPHTHTCKFISLLYYQNTTNSFVFWCFFFSFFSQFNWMSILMSFYVNKLNHISFSGQPGTANIPTGLPWRFMRDGIALQKLHSWLHAELPVLTVCRMRMRASYRTSAVTTWGQKNNSRHKQTQTQRTVKAEVTVFTV